MAFGEYLLGALQLGVVVAAAIWGAVLLVRRAPSIGGPARWLAVALVATAGLSAIEAVPLTLGVLTRGTVLIAAALWIGFAWRFRGAPAPASTDRWWDRNQPIASQILWAAAGLVLGAAAVAIVTRDRTLASTTSDMVGIHLPNVARWIQDGSLWESNNWGPNFATGDYPSNGNLVFQAGILPWHNDFLARATMLPFWALAAFATYVGARELRAPATTSMLAGLAVISPPIVLQGALSDAAPDTYLYFTFAAGLAFLNRHLRTHARADLTFAGVGLGLALGTKWYGFTDVPFVVAGWAAFELLRRAPWRTVLRGTAALAGLALATGGVWLVRNWVESANPIFPAKVTVAGITVFDAPYDGFRVFAGHTIAEYAGKPHLLGHYIAPALREYVGLPGLVLGLVAIAALWPWVRPRRRQAGERRDPRVLLLVLLAVVLAVIYLFLPGSALGPPGLPTGVGVNTRYLMPALLAAAPAAAWLASRYPRVRILIELALAGAVVDGLRHLIQVPVGRTIVVAALLCILIVAVVAARRLWGRLRPRPRALMAAAAVVALAAGALALGYQTQRDFNTSRYRGVDATYDWVLQHAPSGTRIALAGTPNPRVGAVLPMFGPRLGNRVSYVGPFVRGMLRRYSKQPAFARAFARERFDLLLIWRTDATRGHGVKEERWAASIGLHAVARSRDLALFQR